MMKNSQKIIALGLMFLFISCESSTYYEISTAAPKPTYKQNIEPIIAAECNSCHSAYAGQFPILDSYSDLKTACQNGVVLCRIDASCGAVMPTSGRMIQSKIDLIKLWAANGYEN